MAIKGFIKVNASNKWDPIVAVIAPVTHKVLKPIKSTKNPQTGEAKAEIKYTILKI